MDIYLTADGQRLRIPLLPDRLNVKMGAMSVGFQIIKGGEYKIPRGTALTGYSWNGIFPGKSMSEMSFIHSWQSPNRIVSTLRRWLNENKIIKLMVTETTINDDVFIENFVFEHYGVDNISYTLSLTAYRPLYVTTAPPQPEVIIPEQEEEKVEPKATTAAQSSGGTTKAQQETKKNDTSPKKLTANIPSNKSAAVTQNATKKPVVVVSTSSKVSEKPFLKNDKTMVALLD